MDTITSEKTAGRKPFPLLFAEKVSPIETGGTYHDELQVRQNVTCAAGPTSTQSETGTGGHNDTDTNYDND